MEIYAYRYVDIYHGDIYFMLKKIYTTTKIPGKYEEKIDVPNARDYEIRKFYLIN